MKIDELRNKAKQALVDGTMMVLVQRAGTKMPHTFPAYKTGRTKNAVFWRSDPQAVLAWLVRNKV